MGNRAVITTPKKKIGIYLHWNGGYDSVSAFLAYCKIKEYRNPCNDCYGWARMCQVIGNFFGGSLSLGIDEYDRLDTDNGDNGVYIIDENWNIAKREYFDGIEQTEYNLLDCLVSINFCQPKDERVSVKTLCDYCIENGNYTKERLVKELDELIYKCSSDYEQEIIDEIKQVMTEYE